MTKANKIKNILSGMLEILLGVLLWFIPEDGFYVVMAILFLSLFFVGVKYIVFYITMARHMVGGKAILYIGLILFDLGAFTLTLSDIPKGYIMLYLFGTHAFSALVDILRAFEAKRNQSPEWKFVLANGVVNSAVSVLCIVFIGSGSTVVYIYSAGLVYSAVMRIVSSFRHTEMIYIS